MMHRLMPVLAAFVACIAMAVSFAQSAAASPDTAGKIAVAQLSPDRALTGGRPAAGTESAAPPSVMAQAYNWLLTQQQRLNRELANAIKDLKAAGSINAALVLGFIGFSYGVL
ncbi:MAG: hypothetical protein WBY12_02460, partial [Hyphomicrobium sp.]